jgi:hypothetical protein
MQQHRVAPEPEEIPAPELEKPGNRPLDLVKIVIGRGPAVLTGKISLFLNGSGSGSTAKSFPDVLQQCGSVPVARRVKMDEREQDLPLSAVAPDECGRTGEPFWIEIDLIDILQFGPTARRLRIADVHVGAEGIGKRLRIGCQDVCASVNHELRWPPCMKDRIIDPPPQGVFGQGQPDPAAEARDTLFRRPSPDRQETDPVLRREPGPSAEPDVRTALPNEPSYILGTFLVEGLELVRCPPAGNEHGCIARQTALSDILRSDVLEWKSCCPERCRGHHPPEERLVPEKGDSAFPHVRS